MAKGKRSRRPDGHPAKVAVRRERDATRRAGRPPGPDSIARDIVRDVEKLTDAVDAEVWASQLLGAFWDQRYTLGVKEATSGEYSLIFGEPLIEAVARMGGAEARTALSVIAAVDDGALALRASELVDGLGSDSSDRVPRWLDDVGDAEITGAAVMREDVFDDACTVFLEARHSDGETHAVGVLIDNNLGGMAKDILLAHSIDRVGEIMRKHREPAGELTLERVAPEVAAGRIDAAIALTEMTLDPPVGEDYARLRSLALLRVDEVSGFVPLVERDEMPLAEREALCDEFLASREGREFPPDGDEAWAISLAIDFCAHYVDGRPLRWSPVVVELFMANWIPNKVIADEGLFDRLPTALDAWVRFAGRKAGTPEWAIEETRQAIPRWRDAMVARGTDPSAGGPAKQLFTAATEAGVDVEDIDALRTFIAGWNARSDAP